MPSDTGTSSPARSDLSDTAIRAQLERILGSGVFSRSAQLRRFLSFIVEQTLAGQGHTLKESVLAHELYGKGTDFDGGTDPVVRVDARRLRDKLREYYEGRADPVVISLPKGSYVPVFEGSSASRTPSDRPATLSAVEETRPVTHFGRARRLVGALAVVAALVTAVVAWRGLRAPADVALQLLPLASYPGNEGPPALSPDGNLVAFAWSGGAEPGPTDIYVKAVGSEVVRRLTETPNREADPGWSPDGHSIAFVRDGQGVFTMSQLGGAERQVSASGTYVAWGSDSKSVLIRDREGNAGPFGIHQVFLDTLARRRLTQAPLGPGDWRFAVSPDGNTLAFVRYEREGIGDLVRRPHARRGTASALELERKPERVVVDAGWSSDCLLGRAAGSWSFVANRCEQRPTRSRITYRRHSRGRSESVNLEAESRAAVTPCVSNDHPRHRPSDDGPRGPPAERHYRGEALFQFDSARGYSAILARRQPGCVCVVPLRRA